MQQVKAGIKAIYLSGWQVAADNNSYMAMYPDQSLYPVRFGAKIVERINATSSAPTRSSAHAASTRATRNTSISSRHRGRRRSGIRRCAERVRADEGDDPAGAAGVHFEDQLASVKKCGHMAARCSCPRRKRSRSWSRRDSRPDGEWARRRSCWPARTPRRPTS